MINLNSVETDLLRALVQQGVQFLVVGGRAVNFYGYLRVAPDLDLFYSGAEDNSARLLAALMPLCGDKLTQGSLASIVQVNIFGSLIQLHKEIDAVSFADAFDDAVFAHHDDVMVPFISYAHLIQNKLASGQKPDRAKDLDDAAELQSKSKSLGFPR